MPQTVITVQLLGGASLRSGDAPIAGPPAQRHRVALLALVVAAWPQPLSRDRAAALLWPERDQANTRRLLNLAVHVLRAALGEDAIVSTGDGLLWNPARARCDLHELRAAIAAGDPARVVRLHAGALLDGFHLPESTEFGYWLDERRNELAHAYVGALRALGDRQARSGDVHGRVGTCRRLVAADPYSAAYAQELMRALDAAGDRAGAIHHAAEHAQRLRADLELEPDPGVVALAERLRADAASKRRAPTPSVATATVAAASNGDDWQAAGSAGPRRVTSVAVLPFLNLSADPEHEYFADGVTEDVIAHLSKIRALKVIARASVMPFKRRQHSLQEIGETLGTPVLLDGSVRHAGDRVRIVATLVDAETNRHLWAETYDRQLTDIFAIQTDVALRIAAALEADLSGDERSRVRREPTRDALAYVLFLQGRQVLAPYTTEAMTSAIEHFERAIARDPTFALAHATLAMVYAEFAETGSIAPDAAYRRAAAASASALRLDPDLSAAHCTMGHLKAVHEFDWSGAEQAFRRALELSPSNADAYALYGRLCAALGRHDEAVALLKRAQELDPLRHRVDIVTALLRAGRLDEALARAVAAVELDPSERARATLGWAYFLGGQREEGLAELERAASLAPDNAMWLAQLGEAHGMAGNVGRAREILERLEDQARSSYVPPYYFAYVHAGLGEVERAMELLERAVTERAGPVYSIKGSFLLAPLRAHPRFEALLRGMGLA